VKKATIWIWILSLAVPGLVAMLYFGPKFAPPGTDLRFLPRIYATINFITAIVLVFALIAIKQKKIMRHRSLMVTALILSVLFLVLYVVYHSNVDSVKFGGEGIVRYIYFFFLISHILLSVIIVPLVLVTLNWALRSNFEKHQKLARWTWPIWFYVAVSGVIVYFMISPYY
jgi:putative membrane protein